MQRMGAVQVTGNPSVCGGWLPPLMLIVKPRTESHQNDGSGVYTV